MSARRRRRDVGVVGLDDEVPEPAIDQPSADVGEVRRRSAEAEHERDPEAARDDRRVPGRRTTTQGDAGHELGAECRDGRWVEVLGDDDGRPAVGVPQVGRPRAAQQVGHAPADVADIRGARPEILVVDGGQLPACSSVLSRIATSALVPESIAAERRADDPRIPGEQGLGLEDRADLVPGPQRDLAGQRLEVGRPRCRARPASRVALRRRVGRRRGAPATPVAGACPFGSGATSSRRPSPTPGEPARPTRTLRVMVVEPRRPAQPAVTVSARARSSRADDVAPGSW